ncbi:hypothetical protein [Acinetobacter johnsonii]|uniref:hypothetical protein n=1 Tax=Acinetobacter johnsonii TaxID=40214 RepID=UPI00247FF9B7|nr:hypothetical protein [Acinetobacter johnsonii]
MHKIIMPRHRTLIRNAAANRIEQYHSTSFNQIKAKLEQRTHLFIVVLGMLIGSSIALGIGYHLSSNLLNYTLLSLIPVALAYSLRKVYIHTLTHTRFDG